MPFIQNVSRKEAVHSAHVDPGEGAFLISINDPDLGPIDPKFAFHETLALFFLDVEESEEKHAPTAEDAEKILAFLRKAKEQNRNVIVHCTAGVCRSGAVVEAGVVMGFDDTGRWRSPNLLLKGLLLQRITEEDIS